MLWSAAENILAETSSGSRGSWSQRLEGVEGAESGSVGVIVGSLGLSEGWVVAMERRRLMVALKPQFTCWEKRVKITLRPDLNSLTSQPAIHCVSKFWSRAFFSSVRLVRRVLPVNSMAMCGFRFLVRV